MHPRYFNPNFTGFEECPVCSKKNMFGGADNHIKQEIITFFTNNPNPSDSQIHNLAKKLGVNKHRFEEIIYAMLTDLLKNQ